MTVMLDLKPEMEAQLTAHARAHDLSVETYLLRVIENWLCIHSEASDVTEDDAPFITPLEAHRVTARLISAGTFQFPAIDDEGQVEDDA